MSILSMRSSGQTRNIITRTELFLLLNLMDFALTGVMIKQGLGLEANPLLNWLPFWGIGIVKVGVVVLVARYLRNKEATMVLLNVGMGMVVAWNIFWLLYLTLGGKG